MSPVPDPLEADLRRKRRAVALFEMRLREALEVARGGNTAIVIIPNLNLRHIYITQLAHLLDREKDHNARWTQDALHFDGTRGSVRIYPRDHHTYDPRRERLLDYPPSVRTFLHPDVEGV